MGRRDDTTEVIAASAPEVGRESRARSLIGRTLGKFKVLEELGRGGSGEVYRAEEEQLGRSVVVKVLRRDVANETNRTERFLREVKLASRLDHPYAAHVYAYGAEPDGVAWIAMEHVRGMTLDMLVATRGPIPPGLFGPLFVRLCEVVQTAHDLGIIHRDIKGSNVMVIERAGQMLPKLLDFGIAKAISTPTPTPAARDTDVVRALDDQLTGHGAVMGSPHYMAPEQWGAAADADARSDIYALGVVAYLCLGGRLPFADVSRMELPRAHRELTPKPLPSAIPRGVAAAIERAMAKASDARWPNALELARAVQGAIGGSLPETVPLLDSITRDTWSQRGPQPVADAVMRLARATTTVEADVALTELVAITCRWFGVLALAQLRGGDVPASVREQMRVLAGRDDAAPWLRLGRAAATVNPHKLLGLDVALAGATALEQLAVRLDDRDRQRSASALAADVSALPAALKPLELLLDYPLVAGRAGTAESWQGVRRRDREPIVVWDPLGDGEVAVLDRDARVAVRLSPLVQVSSPLPSAEPELFLLWRTGRRAARMVAAPWGYERDDHDAAEWLAALTTSSDDTLDDRVDDSAPYPGLAAYASSDASHFVGREREIEALVNRLVAAPMIAVLGASGAGKTSFMQAGVIPRLAEGYDILAMRPGRHPLRTLGELAKPTDDDATLEYGVEDDDAVVRRLRTRGELAERGLAVVVDQLEELVTLCSDPVERDRFAAVLAGAASGRDAPVRVVVGLRDDFANVVETLAAFRGRFEIFVLATPSPDALRRIITEPARRAQVTVDSRIVDEIADEVAGRAGSLPLLSFTAAELWRTRDRERHRLTYDAYIALGGIAGALSTYADQVYASLDHTAQRTLRDLFARLVAPDGTRVPIPRAELEQLPDAPGVLARLIDARLLVVREDAGTDVVEIIHECLATGWERLVRWRSDDAADRILLADVRTAARRWIDSERSPDLLWRGEALAELRRLADRSASLTDDERTFADASARAVQRTRRLRRGIVAGAMVTLAVAAASMAYLRLVADRNRSAAEASARDARTAAKLAEDRLTASLVAQGRRELNDGRALAALAYFGEALERGADTPALRFMIGVAERAWSDERFVRERAGTTVATLLDAGFVAGDDQGKLEFWSGDAKPLGELALPIGRMTKLLRRGDELIVVGQRGVAIVAASTRTKRHHVATDRPPLDAQPGPGADELTVVFDREVVVYTLDGVVRRKAELPIVDDPAIVVRGATHVWFAIQGIAGVLDTTTMQRRSIGAPLKYGPVTCGDRETIIVLTPEHDVRVFDRDGTVRRSFRAENDPLYIMCSASGDRIGAAATPGVEVYDGAGTRLRRVRFSSDNELGLVRLLGDDMWTGTAEGIVRHYRGILLVGSMPSLAGRVMDIRVGERLVLARGDDTAFVVFDAQAAQLDVIQTPCETAALTTTALAVGFNCGDQQHVYVGKYLAGTVQGHQLGYAVVEPASHRGAVAVYQLFVFEPDGKQIATAETHMGAIAFEDRDRLLVAEQAPPGDNKITALWRWMFETNTWERVVDLEPGVTAIAFGGGVAVVGTDRKRLLYVARGAVQHRVDVRAPVASIAMTPDGKRVAAQLATGVTVILDGEGRTLRELEPADTDRAAEAFDATGGLLVRPHRGVTTIWDTTTGDLLIYDLDLLKYTVAAKFAPDGRLEVAGSEVGTVDVAPDMRATAEILRDIECRVPLRVDGTRLEPRAPKCR